MKQFYRHRLPHWQPLGATIFITYRLFGSLPAEVVASLAEEKRRLEKMPQRANESRRERSLREGKRLFALADAALDTSQSGPRWLAQEAIASIVLENLFHHATKLYRPWAFVIMPNHVHVLVEPLITDSSQSQAQDDNFATLARITHALKSYTAKRANEILNKHGAFWQEESYDHWIRDEKEFGRVVGYIENNPVKAGLADSLEKYEWSSAAFARNEDGSCINQRTV